MKNKKDIDFVFARKYGATANDLALRRTIIAKLNGGLYGAVGLDVGKSGYDALIRLLIAGVASAGADVTGGGWSSRRREGIQKVDATEAIVTTSDDSILRLAVVLKEGKVDRVTYLWDVNSRTHEDFVTVAADTPSLAASEACRQFGWTEKTLTVRDDVMDGDLVRKVVLKG